MANKRAVANRDGAAGWKNRIVGSGVANPAELLANPLNWRVHSEFQQQSVAGVLNQIGWVQQVLLNKTTGRLVDGHLRVELAKEKGEREIPVLYVELSEAEEKTILASLDPLAALADQDTEMLDRVMDGAVVEDAALVAFFDSMFQEGNQATLKDVEPAGASDDRDLGDRAAQIKPVLYAHQIATFEAAIRSTGEKNRGKALIEICRSYIEHQQQTERQFDDQTKNAA